MRINIKLLLLFFFLPMVISGQAQEKALVYVHEPVELLFTIYHLSSPAQSFIANTKKRRDWVDAMIRPLVAPFQKYQEHPAVQSVESLSKQYGVWLPQLVDMGVKHAGMPLEPAKYQTEGKETYVRDLREFMALANQFYLESDFASIFAKNQIIYQAIVDEVNRYMPDPKFFETMEAFYQKSFHSYHICPSPLLPAGNGIGFGPRWKSEKGTLVFNVFSGIDQPNIDPEKLLKPGASFGFNNPEWIRGISTHEFGHSFVNEPLFEYQKGIEAYRSLLKPIKKKMRRQAYGNWFTVLAEHLVRTGEIRIADRLGLNEVRDQLFQDYYIGRGFIYLPHFLDLMRQYESQGSSRSFEDFIPEIVKSLDNLDAKTAFRTWKRAKNK